MPVAGSPTVSGAVAGEAVLGRARAPHGEARHAGLEPARAGEVWRRVTGEVDRLGLFLAGRGGGRGGLAGVVHASRAAASAIRMIEFGPYKQNPFYILLPGNCDRNHF